ncbi:polysaccharide pyruvyl transferase family protein [Myceligenerans indicum]|uniref:Polysaccharide pyruvyl transferase family protein n=1 Tax=Myceligenerans indicum TaxID=2593663 RepID=A0ABS1LI07_9MICO|nr:polysaccharide pyruvyl transferase family protein [Myceligenerans indicum]MBL0885869.1 polysaccharide pyruvyl transferase family protein [Myceligenerans indicum]
MQKLDPSSRRANSRRAAEVASALRSVTGTFPRLDRRTARDLKAGRTAWTDVAPLHDAMVHGVEAALGDWDKDGAATLVALLVADAASPESNRLAGLAAGLAGDDALATDYFYAASKGTGSVERRKRNVERQVSELARIRRIRELVRTREDQPGFETLRRAVLTASFGRPEDAALACARYLVAALLSGDVRPFGELLTESVPRGFDAIRAKEPEALELAVDNAAWVATAGNHPGALDLLRASFARTGTISEQFCLAAANSLSAISSYDAARHMYLLADSGSGTAAAAKVAWIVHDDDAAYHLGRKALRQGSSRVSVRAVLERSQDPVTPSEADAPHGGLGHVAFYVGPGENFGDIVLPDAVRDAVDEAGSSSDSSRWVSFHAHQVFDEEFTRIANEQRGLVVGGGGLFLPDTSPNGNSGWQWNVPRESLEALRVPVYAFAVGFNLFQGQRFTGDLFPRSLEAFTRKCEFLGLRNTGSMSRVTEMLPADLHDKVRFVPCPTTVLRHLRPGIAPGRSGTGRILLNAAFDRSERRFSAGYADFLEQIVGFTEKVRGAGVGADVQVVAHTRGDRKLARDLADAHGLELPLIDLQDMDQADALAVYAESSLVIGMRGHAGMIPFGLGTPILSIVSHPKMRYFLEDIDRLEWGCDVGEEKLGELLAERAIDVLSHEDRYRADVVERQQVLLPHVRSAAAEIANAG